MKKINFIILVLSLFTNLSFAEIVCFNVKGMTCSSCAKSIETALKKIDGVEKVYASFKEKKSIVEFDLNKINIEKIQKIIVDLGYEPKVKKCNKKDKIHL
jgi:copper ion binding protein